MGASKVPKEDYDKVVDMYKNGMSTVKIGEQYNCSYQAICSVLNKCGIARDWNSARKYSLNEHYFDTIDTPNKAYILGILYADGYNNTKAHTVSLQLQEEDKGILDDIKDELKYDAPLYYLPLHTDNNNLKNIYRLTIRSVYISQKLENLGVLNRKSLTLTFPSFLSPDLYSHFIRGYLDGDGNIYCYDKKHDWLVSLVSTNLFCRSIQDIVTSILNINSYVKLDGRRNGITSLFRIGGNHQVMKFLNWVYKDADLKLTRKYNKYQQFVSYYNINNSLAN